MLVAGVVTRLKRVGMQHKGSVGKLMRVQEKSFVQDKENHCPQNKDCKSFFRNISTEYQNHVAKVGTTPISEIPTNGDFSVKSLLFNLKNYLKSGIEAEYPSKFLVVFGYGKRPCLSF